jgi:RTX calcium-binding nonapeptide repeat (4 copies)
VRAARVLVAVGLFGGLALIAPAAADGPQSIDYTCHETTDPPQGVPDFSAPTAMTTSDSADPARVFQPVTWTADVEFPEIQPPTDLYLDNLVLSVPIPDGVAVSRATLVAGAGETPNPPLSALAVHILAGPRLIRVDLPASPGPTRRILVQDDGDVFYPADPDHPASHGPRVVPPVLRIGGVATEAAAGTTVEWKAPRVSTRFVVLSPTHARALCLPDGDPTVLTTDVSTDVQQCDGEDVTVQVGAGQPTAGPDVIQGTPGADTAGGLEGADRFCGLGGNDTFNGGAGSDRAFGGGGNDDLFGNGGPDLLDGGVGDDFLGGGPGADTCRGRTGHDTAAACETVTGVP